MLLILLIILDFWLRLRRVSHGSWHRVLRRRRPSSLILTIVLILLLLKVI